MEAAAPGLTESGAPPVNVIGSEALGLDIAPTDMHLMPDGQILVYAPYRLVLGDGVRWHLTRQKSNTPVVPGEHVAVDADGGIYMATRGGFVKARFDENGRWEPIPASAPGSLSSDYPVPRASIDVGGDWIWHSGSGAMVSWRPGREARVVAHGDDVDHVFKLGETTYFSDRNTGQLLRIVGDKVEGVHPADQFSPFDTIVCSCPFGPGELLIGTAARGIKVFNGRDFLPFIVNGSEFAQARVNALCDAGNGFFAAAIEDYGIVFFDRSGKVIQSATKSQDGRLARSQKLIAGPGGVVWGLLEKGIVRVEFPSRFSSIDAIISNSRENAHPFRHEGRLWIQADGNTYRGVYGDDGRLSGLALDKPADTYVFELSFAAGYAIASTADNAYWRTKGGWVGFAPGVCNLRILDPDPVGSRWLYGAKNEIGWLTRGARGPEIERIAFPGLGEIYNCTSDRRGNIWMELGTGRIGRVRLVNGRPTAEVFSRADGVPEGWAQVFEVNGNVSFNIADKILRFDDDSRRFVEDEGFARRFPGLHDIVGRPGVDARGRLWASANGGIEILENKDGVWQSAHERLPGGLHAYYFTFETSGIVWIHGPRFLMRYDPSVPLLPAAPLRALITRVTLSSSNRILYAQNGDLPPLPWTDNSIAVNFVAANNLYSEPATFDVMLQGSGPVPGSEWIQVGSIGTSVFSRLKEGRYVLRVRPKAAGRAGTEAAMAFTVLPPWYRTPYAYVAYACLGVFGIVLSAWLSTELERKKNARLESLVTLRTKELNDSNARLAAQVADISMLSQAVEQSPVGILITRRDGTIVFANPRMCAATGFTVGELQGRSSRLLRSSMVSPELLAEITATVQRGATWNGELSNRRKDGTIYQVRTTVAPIRGAGGDIPLHVTLEEDITEWLGEQERRRRLEDQLIQSQKLESLGTLAGGIAHDFNNILTGIMGYCELARLEAGEGSPLLPELLQINAAGLRARDLVAQILTFSRRGTSTLAPLDVAVPVTEAMKLVHASTPSTINVSYSLEAGVIRADPTQIQQVVLNLCTNAVHAMRGRPGKLEVTTARVAADQALAAEVPGLRPGPFLRLSVADSGHGMDPEILRRIFDPFFTTKQQGEGTGLGLSIVQGILASHQGFIHVSSAPGSGSRFDLYFPMTSDPVTEQAAAMPVHRGSLEEILVVDDEPTVTEFAAKRLRLFGYRTAEFNDSLKALAAFEAEPGRFKAVVTDLTMPQMTGIDLARRIRKQGSSVPIVIMTGYGRIIESAGSGAIARCVIVNKPFVGDDLARALNVLFGAQADGSAQAPASSN
jgi:PAS domain S-box-containing protein